MKLVYRDDGYSRFSFGMGNHSNHRDIRLDITLSTEDWWHFTNGVYRVVVFTPIRGNFWLDAVSILRFVIFFFPFFFPVFSRTQCSYLSFLCCKSVHWTRVSSYTWWQFWIRDFSIYRSINNIIIISNVCVI